MHEGKAIVEFKGAAAAYANPFSYHLEPPPYFDWALESDGQDGLFAVSLTPKQSVARTGSLPPTAQPVLLRRAAAPAAAPVLGPVTA